MKNIRIIPRLDIKGPNLVKGIHLEGLRVLGKPESFAKYYYENGADELIFQDVVASLYERNSLHDIISSTAKEIFIPLTVGGGIRTIDDIKQVLRAGADKVSINTAAIKNPEFIKEASLKFGSSTIVIAIEAIKQPDGTYQAFVDNGREQTGIEIVSWAQQAEELGAGEIVITSVDKEGTGNGFDIELIKQLSDKINIPLVVHGGAGNKQDVLNVLTQTDADAVCAASIFHYDFIEHEQFDMNETSEGNYAFIKSGNKVKYIDPFSIENLKEYLVQNNIKLRK